MTSNEFLENGRRIVSALYSLYFTEVDEYVDGEDAGGEDALPSAAAATATATSDATSDVVPSAAATSDATSDVVPSAIEATGESFNQGQSITVDQFAFPPQHFFPPEDASAITPVTCEEHLLIDEIVQETSDGVLETLTPVVTAAAIMPLEPVVVLRERMSHYQDKCYNCKDVCMHTCHICKIPCHSSIRKCSNMITEGVFECFLCAGYPSIEQPPQPNKPTNLSCPKCKKVVSIKGNLTRHQKKVACRP